MTGPGPSGPGTSGPGPSARRRAKFRLLTTVGTLLIANGIGFAVVVVLFAKWSWILIGLAIGVGGGMALLRVARRIE